MGDECESERESDAGMQVRTERGSRRSGRLSQLKTKHRSPLASHSTPHSLSAVRTQPSTSAHPPHSGTVASVDAAAALQAHWRVGEGAQACCGGCSERPPILCIRSDLTQPDARALSIAEHSGIAPQQRARMQPDSDAAERAGEQDQRRQTTHATMCIMRCLQNTHWRTCR